MKHYLIIILTLILCSGCKEKEENKIVAQASNGPAPFVWEAANLYFLLTDRFNNGNTSNDINFDRTKEAGKLRGFEGGDIEGVTQKIEDGYFTKLGVNAIWLSPIVEQIHGGTDEGTGLTYGFHGYWTSDWTNIDPNFGTKKDLKNLVETAHKNGIRIVLDAVINHTGPVTENDPVWPEEWVRTSPQCDYTTYDSTVTCTLVKNLPDIRTESNENVELPPRLVEKWKAEGRYDEEVAELNAYFKKTGHPRAPRFYIMKWLTDYIRDFGIDGYRVDTVKHAEETVWQEFKIECDAAFADWKSNHSDDVLDTTNFYLVGEVYGYGISSGKAYDLAGKKINYFDKAFQSLINFEFKWNARQQDIETLFSNYSKTLNSDLEGYAVLNYLASHDDGQPFDAKREKPYEAATKLVLAPGTSQIYYGDESNRSLVIEGTVGDATLRSNMNWDDTEKNNDIEAVLTHWGKLGQFRKNHPAVGAGIHQMITQTPYVFSRRYSNDGINDMVVIGLDLSKGEKVLDVSKIFKEDENLHDAYSNQNIKVKNGKVIIDSEYDIVLLELKK